MGLIGSKTRLEVVHVVVLANGCFGACLEHLMDEVGTSLLGLILLFLVVKVDSCVVLHLVFSMSRILCTI